MGHNTPVHGESSTMGSRPPVHLFMGHNTPYGIRVLGVRESKHTQCMLSVHLVQSSFNLSTSKTSGHIFVRYY